MTTPGSVYTLKPKAKKLRTFRLSDETMEQLDALKAWLGLPSRTAVVEHLVQEAHRKIPPHGLPVPADEDDADEPKKSNDD